MPTPETKANRLLINKAKANEREFIKNNPKQYEKNRLEMLSIIAKSNPRFNIVVK